jgi:hypothetical protein
MKSEILITKDEVIERPNDFDLGSYVRSKLQDDDQKDKCVICGKTSPYYINTHIDFRIGYVEGAGQGCFQSKVCNYDYNSI